MSAVSFGAAGPDREHAGCPVRSCGGTHSASPKSRGHDAQVAVLDAGVEAHAVAPAAEHVVERGDDRVALLAGEVTGGEVDHGAGVVDGDEVAPVRDLVGRELDAHRRGLDRRAAGVVLGGVVAEDREVADVAPRRQPGRDHLGEPDLAARRPGAPGSACARLRAACARRARRAARRHSRRGRARRTSFPKVRWRCSGAVPGGRDGAAESTRGAGDVAEPCPEGGTAQRNRPEEQRCSGAVPGGRDGAAEST